MKRIISIYNQYMLYSEADANRAVRLALAKVQTGTLNRWHGECDHGQVMNLICDELKARRVPGMTGPNNLTESKTQDKLAATHSASGCGLSEEQAFSKLMEDQHGDEPTSDELFTCNHCGGTGTRGGQFYDVDLTDEEETCYKCGGLGVIA